MTSPPDAQAAKRWQAPISRLSPELVRRYELARTPLGRRGYLEADVERFRARIADELARADAEKAELREEIDRLRNYFRQRGFDPSTGGLTRRVNGNGNGAHPTDGMSVQAVNLLSQAQQAADQHIAAAQDYARQLVGDARRQYEEILEQAHGRAEEAAREAAEEYRTVTALSDRVAGHEELTAKLAYMRTFAEVTQVQMRSILDALRQELDRLAELNGVLPPPGASPGASPGLTGMTPGMTPGISPGISTGLSETPTITVRAH